MTQRTPEQQKARRLYIAEQHALAVSANLSALRLQLTRSDLDKEAAPVAYEVSQAHHQVALQMRGRAGVQ